MKNDDENEVKIDVSQIPPHVVESLARATLNAVKRAYQDPAFEAKYQEWLKEQKKKGKVANDAK